MRNQCRTCVQCTLKIINSILTVAGIGMISYSLWMLKKWQTHQNTIHRIHELGSLPSPWFIYTLLTMGIVLCFTTLLGHCAVETANGFSLFIYMFLVTLLLLLQGGVCSYVILKKNWEEYVPEDPTGRFNELKEFVKENISICKFVGAIAIVVQALTVILAFILQTLGPDPSRLSESSDEYHRCEPDVKQSFLVRTSSLPNAHPEFKLSLSDINSMGTQQYGVEEVNLSFIQVDQSRIPFLNHMQAEDRKSACVIM